MLTTKQVVEIREKYGCSLNRPTYRNIAAEYNTSKTSIRLILTGKTYIGVALAQQCRDFSEEYKGHRGHFTRRSTPNYATRKLTDEQVREIRNSTEPANSIAPRYNIGSQYVYILRKDRYIRP